MKLPFLKKKREPKESIARTEIINLEDIIAPSSFEVKQNFLRVGERFAKSFFIFSYPRYLSTGWLSPVINLQHPWIYLFIFILYLLIRY